MHLIEGSSILQRGLCYDQFCNHVLVMRFLFVSFLFFSFSFLLCMIADTHTIHMDYSFDSCYAHRPLVCAQTCKNTSKHIIHVEVGEGGWLSPGNAKGIDFDEITEE